MPSASNLSEIQLLVWLVVIFIAATAVVLGIIFTRRILRARYFEKRDWATLWVRAHWVELVNGNIPTADWKSDPVLCRVIEEIALARREVAGSDEADQLDQFFRASGLLDEHLHKARTAKGYSQRESVQLLGRMRAVEAGPLIIDLLSSGSSGVATEAVRALANFGNPQIGTALVERLPLPFECPQAVLESALLRCFVDGPHVLAKVILDANDAVRPVLARVLAEVAIPEMEFEAGVLAGDANEEVRASAARLIGAAAPSGGSAILCQLAEDPVWFVRLRAMAALGALRDPFTVPTLMRGLCDTNRLVRLRAAKSLASMGDEQRRVLRLAHSTRDRYALQAFACELERTGTMRGLVTEALARVPARKDLLLILVDAGCIRVIAEAAAEHSDVQVRRAAVDFLSGCGDANALEYLQFIDLSIVDRSGTPFREAPTTESLAELANSGRDLTVSDPARGCYDVNL